MPHIDGSSSARRPVPARLRALTVALPVFSVLLFALMLRSPGAPDVGTAPPEVRPALVSLGPGMERHRASEPSGAVCSLPVGQQVAAVRAFAEMMPVFRHPRCLNCHGGFDIMSEAHAGESEARESGLDPRGMLTTAERLLLHAECATCHDNIRGSAIRQDSTLVSGWMVAPLPMLWVGKSDEALCMQLKGLEPDGRGFIDHIDTDHHEVQFIEAAFNGDRGLGLQGLADHDLSAEPPPGTQRQLTALARRWVGFMGAERGWVGDPPCGCVPPELELTVTIEVDVASAAMGSGRMTATVPLTTDSSGVYHGEAPLRASGFELSPAPPGCTMRYTYTDGVLVVREARIDATDDGQTTVELSVRQTRPGGTIELACPNVPMPMVMPNAMISAVWDAVHQPDRVGPGYRFAEFEAPAGAPDADGRTMVARKEVTRRHQEQGAILSGRTVFELWAVPTSPE